MDSNANQLAPIDFDKAYIIAQQPHENGFRASPIPEFTQWLNVRLDLQGAELIDPTSPGTELAPATIPPGPEDRKGKFEPEPGFYEGFPEVSEGRRYYFYWDKTQWTLWDLGNLPSSQTTDVIEVGNSLPPTSDATARGTIKPSDLTIEQEESNQLFDKATALLHSALNNDGTISSGSSTGIYATGVVSAKIPAKTGKSHVTVSGTQGSGTKHIVFYNASDEQVGVTGVFTSSPYTRAVPAGYTYFRVYVNSRNDAEANLDLVMINWGQVALPVEPFDKKSITKINNIPVGKPVDTSNLVNREELNDYYTIEETNNEMVSFHNDVQVADVPTNQLFDKNNYLQDATMSASGVISQGSAYAGGQVTGKIAWKEGESHITLSGYTGASTKYIVSFNSSDQVIGVAGNITASPYTYPKQTGVAYVRAYFHSRFDEGDDKDTFMMNWGQTALPYEPFEKKEVVAIRNIPIGGTVDTDNLVNKEELNDYYTKEEVDSKPVVIPDQIDNRYVDQFPSADKLAELERLENTVKSLRSIKGTDSGEVAYTIPNIGSAIGYPVLVPINVHWGNNTGASKGGEIYMDQNCRKDFTDIRFLDANNNLLDCYKVSNGKYEFIYDDNIKLSLLITSDGNTIFGSHINESQGISKSTDNMQTWTQLFPAGAVAGLNANDDLFFGDGGKLYKSTKASGYTDKVAVISLENDVLYRYQSFSMDDQNNIYVASYQEAFNVRLYKSTDGGDNFTLIYTNIAQHIHSIVMDRSITPNRIFLNIDGEQWSARTQRTVYSNDRGATWTDITFFDNMTPDYGVLYANGNVLIGSGEGDIKGFPSIYKSKDFGRTWKVVFNASVNIPIITKFKGALYTMNFARGANPYPTIWRSDDEGDNWVTIANLGPKNTSAYNSIGWRYGAIFPIQPTGDVLQMVVAGDNVPAMRIKAEDDNYQSLWYVKIPNLPASGLPIKVGYGYLAQDVEANLFRDIYPQNGLIAHLPLNEFGDKVRELVRGKVFDITGSEWEGGVTKRFAKTVPYRHPSVMGGVTIKKDLFLNGVEYGLNFRKNFTVNFWYKMKVNHAPGNTEAPKFLFGTKLDSGFNMSRRYRTVFRLANTNVINSIPNSFRTVFWTEYQMVTIVVTNETLPTVKYYTNGRLSGSVAATSFNNATSYIDWKIGGGNNQGSGGYINDDGKMTDFKLWNRILTDDEIIRMYEGAKIVMVK